MNNSIEYLLYDLFTGQSSVFYATEDLEKFLLMNNEDELSILTLFRYRQSMSWFLKIYPIVFKTLGD